MKSTLCRTTLAFLMMSLSLSACGSMNPTANPSSHEVVDVPMMGTFDPAAYEGEAERLPTELIVALARDLGMTGAEHLANAAEAASAAPVIQFLVAGGVPTSAIYIERGDLKVNDLSQAELVSRVGAVLTDRAFDPATTHPTLSVTAAGATRKSSDEGTHFRGGLPFGGFVNGTFSPFCTIGLNGYRVSDGEKQFITAGSCVVENTGPYSVADVTTAGSSAVAAESLGTSQSAAGLAQPDGVAVISSGSAVTPLPEVATWAGGTGAAGSGTPVIVRDAIAPVVGAAICKSALATGWTCGTITQIGSGQADVGTIDFETFIASICVAPGEGGSPGMSGNSFVGIVTTTTWSDTCNAADQAAAHLYTAFISYASSTGQPSIKSSFNSIWQPAISIAVPSLVVTTVGSKCKLVVTVDGGSANYAIAVTVGSVAVPGSTLSSSGFWSNQVAKNPASTSVGIRVSWGIYSVVVKNFTMAANCGALS